VRPTRPVAWLHAVVLLLASAAAAQPPSAGGGLVRAVAAVGMTVADVERSVDFYARVLGFERVSDVEVWGADYERLQGIFGLRMRVVRMRLGDELIELTEYLTPRGRPVPADSRSHDRWFQHIAIIVSDMDRAYAWLRRHRVEHASPAPQRLPDWNPSAGGTMASPEVVAPAERTLGFTRGFLGRDPDGHAFQVTQP
jgi:catechol 2,3-dioxygenase-like lactoylglutathione lyase family enzyme